MYGDTPVWLALCARSRRVGTHGQVAIPSYGTTVEPMVGMNWH